jgi:hypothetical protein
MSRGCASVDGVREKRSNASISLHGFHTHDALWLKCGPIPQGLIICQPGFAALSWAMPWRRKPNSRLRYWSNGRPSDTRAEGFETILVYCVGPPDRDPRPCCWHPAVVPLDRLPDWDWYDVCAHLKCTRRGSVGWADPRPNWSEVIDYGKGIRVCT